MTCSLHSKFDAAVSAAKAVFDEAHEKDTLSDNDLNLLFVYYQGLKKIRAALPKHDDTPTITFSDEYAKLNPDGTSYYDPDYNINLFNNDPLSGDINFDNIAAGPVTVGAPVGEDTLVFSTEDNRVTPQESDEYDPPIKLG
tara:strand:+ start:880 stop:1302 length:423 start_codon:yes stop_codon:yes gene_type:complete